MSDQSGLTIKVGNYLKLNWGNKDRFLIEKLFIKNGGFIDIKGVRYGNGLYHHYKAAITALWPHFQWHNWSELLIKSWCEHGEVGVMGPASSGKTYCSAAFSLVTFYCWPKGTSVIMSSTTREGLQLRVWGAVKELHSKAKERRDWLPGRTIESRFMLTGAEEQDEAQDFRDGIIGVACFLPGTLVDTPYGKVPIERLKAGDEVLNATGVGVVKNTQTRESRDILKVYISDGRSVYCTPEHPFFTGRGWVRAVDLQTSDLVFSAHESLHIMRKITGRVVSKPKVLLTDLLGKASGKIVRGMRIVVSSDKASWWSEKVLRPVLLPSLRWPMGIEKVYGEGKGGVSGVRPLQADNGWGSHYEAILLSGVPECASSNAVQGVRKIVPVNQRVTEQAEDHILRAILQAECDEEAPKENRINANSRGTDCLEDVSGINVEPAYSEWSIAKGWLSKLVQVGHRVSGSDAGRGSGWWNSSDSRSSGKRFETNTYPGRARVDRVEIFKSRSTEGAGACGGNYTVHNIEVSGHPSYSVNGMLVHNCKVGGQFVGLANYVGLKNDRVMLVADEASLMAKGFIDSVANLRKNPSFKLIAMGNPKDRTDALGVVCEPHESIGGWEGLTQEEKTATWRTRAPNGLAIQICGYDSPNFQYPRGVNPFRGLITPEMIEADLAYYGKDSLQFSMMNLGMMPKDGGVRRVITRSMCEQNKAFEDAVWMSSDSQTRILGLDAAYSGVGGDRCALIDLTFGPDVNGSIIIAQNGPPIIVPVKQGRNEESPEDQIARFTMMHAIANGVKPSCFGLDSTGKGSLVAAFARIWSTEIVPVEFGGLPSDTRMVRMEGKEEDNRTEREAYGKQVTALWFASRSVIVGGQMRQLAPEVVEDGSYREWGITKSGKVDVEPKDKTKERMGRSPDLWDSLVVAIEVARRNGFVIKTGAKVGISKTSFKKLNEMADRHRKMNQKYQLTPT